MKANYPVEFLAASMTLDMGNTDKLAEFRAEAERLGIKVEPPSINRSGVEFDVAGNTIHYALAALRGVGRQAVEEHRGGARRARLSPTSPISPAASIRAPSTSACWKAWSPPAPSTRMEANRARAFAAVDRMLATAQRTHDDAAPANRNCSAARRRASRSCCRRVEPWLPAERLQREYEAVGFFLTGHPLDDYAAALKRLRVQSWAEFARAVKAGAGAGRVAGTVVSRTERRTKNGSKMGIIGLSDPTGHYEAVLFAEGLGAISRPARAGQRGAACSSPPRCRATKCAPASSRSSRSRGGGEDAEGLRVFLRDGVPLEGVARRLEPMQARRTTATGPITATARSHGVAARNGNEVEVKLPAASRFPRRSPAPSRRCPAW